MIINGNECGDNKAGHWVYYGMGLAGKVDYVGTTTQKPSDRFRWHRNNGKDLKFMAIKNFENAEEMLDYEQNCILRLKPALNKKEKRHNDNRKLSEKTLKSREDNDAWCQGCFRRRVSGGYRKCMWCS